MSLPWFAFNVKAFITDTMRLSTEAKGAYLLLMLDYYEQGKPAPDDDEVLASITGLAIETWRRHRRVVEPLFTLVDGFWRHKRCDEELATASALAAKRSAAGKKANETRWAADPDRTPTRKPKRTPDRIRSGHATDTERSTVSEAEFGPARTQQGETVLDDRNNADRIHGASESDTASDRIRSPSTIHIDINTEVREGANAPSPAGVLSIGSLIDPEFTPESFVIASAIHDDGISAEELSGWLDDWKGRCLNGGTRLPDWHAAWDREYDRRVKLRAKSRPKPRVSVSKKRLEKIPDGWSPGATHHKIAGERSLNIIACLESFSDYLVNKRPDWKDVDAAFRQWLKSPHRTEFTRNGQAQATRRAPAPGNSILDAASRFEQRLDAATGRSPTLDQQDGQAAVLSIPEE